jgi:glycosyltransferase involved in cell wall biosynthesis
MRILSISIDTSIFNKQSKTLERISGYAEMADGMHMICYTPRKSFPITKKGKLIAYPTNSLTKFHFIIDAYQLGKKIIKENNFNKNTDAITTQDPFETGLIGYFLKKKFGLGLNIQEHGNFYESPYWKKETFLNLLRYYLGKFIIDKSDSIRTVSLREKEALTEKLKIDQARIINFPVFTDYNKIKNSASILNVKNRYPGFSFYVLTMCRLEKQKNIPMLIDAFGLLTKKISNPLLIIVGSGCEEKRIRASITKNGLNENIIIEPWTENPYDYYKTSDLFIMSSDYEGFPRTIIESIACNCPIVMTNQGSAGEFIKNGENGLVTAIGKHKELANAMIDIAIDKEKGKIMSKQASEDLKRLFSQKDTLTLMKKSWQMAIRNKL